MTRTTAEPPSHLECAQYAVRACPFLTRPRAHRREVGIPEEATMAGVGLKRNPGVSAIWVTRDYSTWRPPGGGVLLTIGDPERVEWWAEGRQATYPEVTESVESGAPALFKLAAEDRDPEGARADLTKQFARFLPLLDGLLGREARTPENAAVLLASRREELAWFATHPEEVEYVRPVRAGEFPTGLQPLPTHVQVKKLTEYSRSRVFGIVVSGEFRESREPRL